MNPIATPIKKCLDIYGLVISIFRESSGLKIQLKVFFNDFFCATEF